ncbi:MAG: hypothetical protein AB7T09_37340 [Planctomycetota bacterium]
MPKKKLKPAPTIDLELPFGLPAPDLFCPACGVLVLGAAEGAEEEPCPHLLYVYLGDVGLPHYVSPGLAPLDEDSPDFLDDVERLLAKRGARSVLRFSLTTGGMACGPVWNTVYVGIDLLGDQGG